MDVFISWSGERSGLVANVLAEWFPKVIQAVRPWLSSESIDPGARWNAEVANALEESNCGVLCLTPENLSAPWMLFEAGALSKAVTSSRVIPYLLGFEPRELQGPLSQFQAVRADESGTVRLVTAVNVAGEIPLLSPELLAEAFRVWWPQIAPEIERLAASIPSDTPAPQRSVESMLGELLELTRARSLPVSEPELQRLIGGGGGLKESTLGERILSLRLQRMLTQQELAHRVGVSQAYLSKLESGRASPSVGVFVEIANALGVSASSLVSSLSEASGSETAT